MERSYWPCAGWQWPSGSGRYRRNGPSLRSSPRRPPSTRASCPPPTSVPNSLLRRTRHWASPGLPMPRSRPTRSARTPIRSARRCAPPATPGKARTSPTPSTPWAWTWRWPPTPPHPPARPATAPVRGMRRSPRKRARSSPSPTTAAPRSRSRPPAVWAATPAARATIGWALCTSAMKCPAATATTRWASSRPRA